MLLTNFLNTTGEAMMRNHSTWLIQHVPNHIKEDGAILGSEQRSNEPWTETHPPSQRFASSWKTFTMRQSLMSIIFATALLSEYYTLSVALPMGKTDDGSMEQDTFASLLSNDATENDLGDSDLATAGKTRGPRVFIIAEPSLLRDLRVLQSGLSMKRRADDNNQVFEHRDTSQDLSIPILRRDTMRCMVGRVYRPCWEV